MCIICVHLSQEKLTLFEAERNLNEMSSKIDEKHFQEVKKNIYKLQEEKFYKNIEKFLGHEPYSVD